MNTSSHGSNPGKGSQAVAASGSARGSAAVLVTAEIQPRPQGKARSSEEQAKPSLSPQSNDELKNIDQSLADDVDHLMESDFPSIDAVLEGAFDENSEETLTLGPDLAARHEELDVSEKYAVGEAVKCEESEVASLPSPPAQPAESFDRVESAVSIEQDAAPPREHESPEETTPTGGRLRHIDEALSPIIHTVRRSFVSTLEMVNLPVRTLPESTRTIVDWVALSLLLWVPVVWAAVLIT